LKDALAKHTAFIAGVSKATGLPTRLIGLKNLRQSGQKINAESG
jgi:hypothetical protein